MFFGYFLTLNDESADISAEKKEKYLTGRITFSTMNKKHLNIPIFILYSEI